MSVVNAAQLLELAPIIDMLPTKQREFGVSHGLAEAGYDIRIKQDIQFLPGHDLIQVWEPGPNKEPELFDGRFCLASAIEEFNMPDCLVGIVHDKSTWARQGLSVFNTVIEPGWKGFLTLELVFHGNRSVHIPAGAGIAQVMFHRLEQPAAYNGKYQNQADKPVSSLFEDA